MIEQLIFEYLRETLEVSVFMEEPEEKPGTYVLLEKTGSGRKNYVFQATLAIQSYAPTLYEAACLNEEVKRAMITCTTLGDVCSCELNSDYNFTDQETHRNRYQAVFELVHY